MHTVCIFSNDNSRIGYASWQHFPLALQFIRHTLAGKHVRNVTFTKKLKRNQLPQHLQPSTCRLQTGGKSINCVIVWMCWALFCWTIPKWDNIAVVSSHISLLSAANVQLTQKKNPFLHKTNISFLSVHGNGSIFGAVNTFTRPPSTDNISFLSFHLIIDVERILTMLQCIFSGLRSAQNCSF